MRRFLRSARPRLRGFSPNGRALLGIRALLARPGACGAVEAAPRRVVRALLDGAEYGALERAGEQQAAPADVAVLRVRRLLLVYEAPDLVERLLADHAREQPENDRQRGEEHLRHSRCIPEPLYDDPARVVELGQTQGA